MRVTVLANRDLASNYALNLLLPVLAGEHELCVFLSGQVGGAGNRPEPLRMLKFFEQGLFGDLLFLALGGGECPGRLLSFDALAAKYGARTARLDRINSEAGLAMLAAAAPDLILSIRYGGILREAAIAIPRHGVLNLHSGLLPQYRGVMATFYAMLNGESHIGTTVHYILDAGIDTGDTLGQTRRELDYQRSYLWNVLQLYPAGVELMCGAVASIARGAAPPGEAQMGAGCYYTFPTENQLRAFGEKGLRLYDVEEITEFAKQYLES